MAKCPKCNEEVSSRAKFCPECGTKLGKQCPNCKSWVGEVKFCPECGTKMPDDFERQVDEFFDQLAALSEEDKNEFFRWLREETERMKKDLEEKNK